MSKTMDALGDRMKMYEQAEAGRKLMPLLPALARIDGRCFSKFTRGLARPYDPRMSDLMMDTTKYLVEQTGASIGYTQSDEISLAWYTSDPRQEIFFGGKITKMVSTLAAMASVYFNYTMECFLPEKMFDMPTFDARVWNVPTQEEGANCILWRVQDAVKNSISMAARHYFSHAELMNKHTGEMQEMLFKKAGVNWNDYPSYFKQGTFIQRVKSMRTFSQAEIERLAPHHPARLNPSMEFERTDVVVLEMPHFGRVVNRAGVVFRGEQPMTEANLCPSPYDEVAP